MRPAAPRSRRCHSKPASTALAWDLRVPPSRRSSRLKVCEAETRALRGRELHLKDKSYLRWTDSADTMVVTFGEVAEGARTGPVKRQYWARRGQQWQIFFEGVIG